MALAPPSAGACRTGSVILTAKLIAGHDAEGERRNPGQDDPDAAGVLDLDPGPEMGTSPGSSSGPEPGRRPCPGTPRRRRPPRPRPPGRRRMRLPGASIFLFRHHAERRGRSERTHAYPPICVVDWHMTEYPSGSRSGCSVAVRCAGLLVPHQELAETFAPYRHIVHETGTLRCPGRGGSLESA